LINRPVRLAEPWLVNMTNLGLPHRHVRRNYFRGNCRRHSFAFAAPSIIDRPVEIDDGARHGVDDLGFAC
jgi:hypothetical protein